MKNIYERIVDFVESKLNNFERPELCHIASDTFATYFDDNVILVPSVVCDVSLDDLHDWYCNFLIKFIKEHYKFELGEDNMTVFCMLHEIGHIITLKCLNNEDVYNIAEKMNENIEEGDNMGGVDYRLLPIEAMADAWAIMFMRMYPEVLEIKDVIVLQ